MNSIDELTEYVSDRAKTYISETGTVLETFPTSIVDFVIEYAANGCHFPDTFTDADKLSVLERGKNSLAMACVDVWAKSAAEGQTTHSENGVSRTYKSAWITFDLLSYFPNYVNVLVF